MERPTVKSCSSGRARRDEVLASDLGYYESWTVHISNGQVPADRYAAGTPDHDTTTVRINADLKNRDRIK